MSKLKKTLGRYVDPRTDYSFVSAFYRYSWAHPLVSGFGYGFKFYFGREENKENLINFLNSLFAGEKVIQDLHFQDGEHDGDDKEERKVILDLYCIGTDGEHFLIEMQQIFQDFFRDRAVFYTSRVIQKQVKKGFKGNTYELPEVYFIGVLEFSLDEGSDKYFYDVALCDKETNEVFYDKLGYKFIVLPNFNKGEDELETIMDQWLYLLRHLSEMDEIPKCLDKRILSSTALSGYGRIFHRRACFHLSMRDRYNFFLNRNYN